MFKLLLGAIVVLGILYGFLRAFVISLLQIISKIVKGESFEEDSRRAAIELAIPFCTSMLIFVVLLIVKI